VVLNGAAVLVDDAAIVEDPGVVWVELDRPLIVLDGAVELAFVVVGDAAVVEGAGVIWVELVEGGGKDGGGLPPRLNDCRAPVDYLVE
jgi:hypothetical protein